MLAVTRAAVLPAVVFMQTAANGKPVTEQSLPFRRGRAAVMDVVLPDR